MKPDVAGLTAAIERLADPGRARAARRRAPVASREELRLGADRRRTTPSCSPGLAVREGPPRDRPLRAGWRSRRTRDPPRRRRARPPAPFVVGATRSGTTLLRLMLDAHPEIAIPSETHFIPELVSAREKHGASREQMLELLTSHRRWGDFTIEPERARRALGARSSRSTGPDAVRAFYALYGDKQGKHGARWGDKTPGYVKSMREIQAYLPEARFIHLIRDGRDVALSVLKQTWGPQSIEAAAEKLAQPRQPRPLPGALPRLLHGGQVRGPRPPHRARAAADLRVHRARLRRAACSATTRPPSSDSRRRPGSCRAAHGEAQSAEKRLMSHAKTFEPPNPAMIGTWTQRMSPADRAAYEALAGDLLVELGYETDCPNGTGEVHEPRRGPRLPRPVRRALAMAKHATGIRDPAEPRDPGPVPDRRRPLRHRPARRDARRAPRDEDAARDRLRPAARRDDPLRADDRRAGHQGDGRRRPARGPRPQRGRDARAPRAPSTTSRPPPCCASFYDAAAEKAGDGPLGRRHPLLPEADAADPAGADRGPLHPRRSATAATPLAARPAEINTGAAIATGQRWNKKVRSARVQAHLMNHLPRGPLRGPDRRPRDGAAPGLRVHRARLRPGHGGPARAGPRSRPRSGRSGAGASALEPEQLEAFEEVAGPMLDELGYRRARPSAVR